MCKRKLIHLKDEDWVELSHLHPLEFIPFFRKWKVSLWRDVIYTFIFNTLVTIGITLLFLTFSSHDGLPHFFTKLVSSFIISQCIGFSFFIVFYFFQRKSNPLPKIGLAPLILGYSTISYLTFNLFNILLMSMQKVSITRYWSFQYQISIALVCLLITLCIFFIYRRFYREKAHNRVLLEKEIHLQQAQISATTAHLRALQAQIEPHFLFNTLANVQALIDEQPHTAQHMLEQFIFYLRQSLSASRQEQSNLAQEFAMMESFLHIFKVRMGERLQFQLHMDSNLGDYPIAPMLIQPLIENAIKHGIDPKVKGGRLEISAREIDDHIVICIKDDGIGLKNQSPTQQGGVGLQNIRERLVALYQHQAQFNIYDIESGGTQVELLLPFKNHS